MPVFVSIPGGGFNINTGPILNGRKLIKASDDNMVIVQFNYRVGPYGFLASTEMAEDQSVALNAGLLDQRAALQWVQKHISKVCRASFVFALVGSELLIASCSLEATLNTSPSAVAALAEDPSCCN